PFPTAPTEHIRPQSHLYRRTWTGSPSGALASLSKNLCSQPAPLPFRAFPLFFQSVGTCSQNRQRQQGHQSSPLLPAYLGSLENLCGKLCPPLCRLGLFPSCGGIL